MIKVDREQETLCMWCSNRASPDTSSSFDYVQVHRAASDIMYRYRMKLLLCMCTARSFDLMFIGKVVGSDCVPVQLMKRLSFPYLKLQVRSLER